MTIINTYAAESWDKVYTAFSQINFTSFDFDTVKESLLQYLQIYYAEDYNDFIESSELIALLELFAYAAELIAYRTDVAAHENFISTAQRKQSILRLAKLISYSASRNIPARGLVKINTVQTDQVIYDSLGNNLSNQIILWNDPNNTNWKEQFFLVMNASLTVPFGQPSKSFQIADVLMQLYTFNNQTSTLNNGVFSFNAATSTSSVAMECVPIDIDSNGPFERAPDSNAQFNLVYASDGRGDGSDYTGFLMFVKQGTLLLTNYTITQPTANRRIELSAINVNNTDVWVYQVDNANTITQNWVAVNNLADQTLAFNSNTSTRYQYQIESLENDQIALLFGDGNFSDTPVGTFQFWTRTSVNQDINIPKTAIQGQAMQLVYTDATSVNHNFNMTFSLTSALQNNSASETIEHVRQSAPSTYYAQNRMVNGQDYNTFMLQDSTILKLNTINRTFAGQPKYIEWNDASGAYQNIKLFGDDLTMSLTTTVDLQVTTSSSRGLIDSYIQPALQTDAIYNTLTHLLATTSSTVNGYTWTTAGILSYPRRVFIEDNRAIYYDINGNPVAPYGYDLGNVYPNSLVTPTGSLLEKTMIQGALDRHYYGEQLSTVIINGNQAGVVPDPVLNPTTTDKLYTTNLPRTIDGVNLYPPGDTGSGYQPIQAQKYFGLRYNPLLQTFGNGTISLLNIADSTYPPAAGVQNYGFGDGTANPYLASLSVTPTASTVPAPANGLTTYNYKVETLTIEMGSDGNTFTVTSNLRGSLPSYSLSQASISNLPRWSEQAGSELLPCDFVITAGSTAYEAGDAFVIDISYQNFAGGIVTLGTIIGGSGYVDGSYPNTPLIGGAGSGALATVVVTGGAVTSVTITTAGIGYVVGNVLSTPRTNLGGGTGTNFEVPVTGTPPLQWGAVVRAFGYVGSGSALTEQAHTANLSGWWQLIPNSVVFATANPPVTSPPTPPGLGLFNSGASDGPNLVQQITFDTSANGQDWIFLLARTDDGSGNVLNWSIYNRDMKIIASSPTTNFWYNQDSQITDSETLLPLYDKIRILRSNLDAFGQPLKVADIYDCVNFAYDQNGNVITNSLELLPTETINFITAGTGTPGNLLQFENFAAGSYQFTLINVTNSANPTIVEVVPCTDYIYTSGYDVDPYDVALYDSATFNLISEGLDFTFLPGNFMSNVVVNGTSSFQLARQLVVPAPAIDDPVTQVYGCNAITGLDFMWQHYTPDANLIDPSVSNIHDAYILTQGYYTSVQDWINGITTVEPSPPTPLDLLTSYGYLLEYKMLSDTVVLHPGKIKLLFGAQADQTLQATFMVVVAPTATFTSQRIQQEVINTINTYFAISNWDFGDTFYATELIGLIHQALPTQISSVVIVPTYSVNSFGSLFTIESGIDEVLQSCATVSNVQIVAALTPSVLRQT
jgi:hypothetical protein